MSKLDRHTDKIDSIEASVGYDDVRMSVGMGVG